MGVRYSRNLGPVKHLQVQEWTDETASGRPALRCACGTIFDLPESHRVLAGGLVAPVVKCPSGTCSFLDFIELEAWGEEVLR